MKINKLLFFLLAVFSLNSCVEYVDNGTKPEGPELPEEQKFTAIHSNPDEAKYVGDEFEFTAMLNSVDVTKSTKFKVSGTTIPGNTYTPVKTGSHTVIATMDNYTATFKFIVEEDEEEPEPTGNRIEFDGEWKPVTNTFWAVTRNAQNQIVPYNYPTGQGNTTVLCTRWFLISADESDIAKIGTAANTHYMLVYIPVDMTDPNAPVVYFPHEAPTLYTDGGYVTFDGNANEYNAESNTYNFVSGTDPQSGVGTANYTADTSLVDNSEMAKLFWNGQYTYASAPAPAPKGTSVNNLKLDVNQIKNLKLKKISSEQIKNLKLAK